MEIALRRYEQLGEDAGAGDCHRSLGVLALMRILDAHETLVAIRWGMAFIMCMWGLWAVKVWAWMEIQRNALTREIKRLELQVVHLGSQIKGLVADQAD